MEKRRISWFTVPFLIFIIAFYILPLTQIFWISISEEGWLKILTSNLFLIFLKFSLTQAILTTVLCLLLGIPTGYALGRMNPFGKKILSVLVLVPFLIPPMSILLGFVIIYEPKGILFQIFGLQFIDAFGTLEGIVLAHIIYNISIVTRLVASNFETIDNDKIALAKTNGANELQLWRYVYLPHITPSIYASALLVFLLSFNSFAVVLTLGNVKLQTLEVMIYSQSRFRLDFITAAKIAVIQFLLNVLITISYIRIVKRTKYKGRYSIPVIPSIKSRIIGTAWLYGIIVFTWQPIFATIFQLMRTDGTSLIFSESYNSVLGASPLRVLFNTIFFAILTGIISLLLAVLLVFNKFSGNNDKMNLFYNFISILPLMSSSITLSLGILLVYKGTSFFSDSIWIFIVSAHILAALPFVTQTIFSGVEQVPDEYIYLSLSLGATQLKSMKTIILPLLFPSIIVAFLLGIAISFGEFGATFFLVRGEWTTISLGIQKLFATRNNLLPLQYAMILIIVTVISFSLVEMQKVKK